jgi:hypothetical protein
VLSGSPSSSERRAANDDAAHDDVANDDAGADPDSRAPHPALLLALFLVIAIGLTFPNISRLRTYIAGDSGDGLLNLWIIRRVQIGLPHGWHAFWDPPIFFPARGTLAYSDTLLPVALVQWPLRLLLGDALALNVIYLGSWVLSSWCTYRLAMRFVRYWGAAVVAALAYTYAASRLIHQQHLQLVVGGALVPLVLLLLLRLFDEPTVKRGAVLGLSFAAVTLSASYFGAMVAVIMLIVAGGLLMARRSAGLRPYVVALAVAAGIAVVLVAPIGVKYWAFQRHPEFRRSFDPTTATHLADLAATGVHSYLLDHVSVIAHASRPNSRGIENRLFPGFVAIGFGIAGAVVVARRLRSRARPRDRRMIELLLIAFAGAVAILLSLGDWIHVGRHRVPLPFAALRDVVPGFAGIRAVSRLELGFQLALALLAAVGLDAFLRKIPNRARAIVALGLVGLVVAECAMSLVFVRVPTSADDGGVDAALRARPIGVVLELPISSADRPVTWANAETPRQLLALRDHDPRVNGYSGFRPKGFDTEAAVLDHFPAPDALKLARQLGVRYVVLRTRLVGELSPTIAAPVVDINAAGRYDPEVAAGLVAALPPGTALPAVELPGGYLVELKG